MTTEAEQIAALARDGATPHLLTPAEGQGVGHFVVPEGHRVETVDDREHAWFPPRKRGTVQLHDAGSFTGYVNAHRTAATVLYGDVRQRVITAVLNDHEAESTDPEESAMGGWGDFAAVWKLQYSDAWQTWVRHQGNWMGQQSFAEHIEDNAADVIEPSAAEMLEVAQTLQANSNVAFRSHTRLHDGQTQLRYEATVESRAGERGQLTVPTVFTIGVPIFDGLDPYKVQARFRFRVADGALAVMYRLERGSDIVEAAFTQAWDSVAAGVDVPALRGTPPTGRM